MTMTQPTTFAIIPDQQDVSRMERVLVYHGHDAAGVEPPQANGPGQDRHHLTFFDRRVLWTRLQPAKAELLPALQGGFGGGKDLLARTKFVAGVVHDVPNRRGHGGCAYR